MIMANIINRPTSLAASLGQAVGGGINEALLKVLNGIAQNKVSEIENRQNLSPFRQKDSTLEALSLIGQQPAQDIVPQAIETLTDNQPSPLTQALQTITPQEPDNKKLVKKEPSLKKSLARIADKKVDKAIGQSVKTEQNKELNPDPLKHAKVEQKQDAKLKKIPKLSEKQQLAADKETKPYFDEVSKQAKAAKDGNMRLDRMEELVKRGNLTNPTLASFLDFIERGIPLWSSNIGLDLHALESIDSQEFRKLSNDFIKSAKEFFGSRVTDQDLKAFLKTVPTLNQSNEGRVRVIQNLRSFNDIAIIKKKAMNEIIAENGGERPRNLEELVDERTSDQVDAIAKQFKERMDIKSPEPEPAYVGFLERLAS